MNDSLLWLVFGASALVWLIKWFFIFLEYDDEYKILLPSCKALLFWLLKSLFCVCYLMSTFCLSMIPISNVIWMHRGLTYSINFFKTGSVTLSILSMSAQVHICYYYSPRDSDCAVNEEKRWDTRQERNMRIAFWVILNCSFSFRFPLFRLPPSSIWNIERLISCLTFLFL